MKRKVIIDKEFDLSQKKLSEMSTFEIKHRLLKIAPELSNDIKKFKSNGVNYSEYANNAYKARTTHALFGELLKRDAENRKRVRSFSYGTGFLATVTALTIILGIGYVNRGEKDKVIITPDGIVTYTNGMIYSGFSSYDLSHIFDYSQNSKDNGIVLDFISDCFSGYDNMFFLDYSKDTYYSKALNDAEMLLKYLGFIKLDGISNSRFYMDDISLEEFKKFDLCVSDDIQSLCKIHMIGDIINKYNPEIINDFYKSIYYVKNGNKIYFNSKEEFMNFVGFKNEEDYINFVREVVYTLNGNVFYSSDPTASEFYVEDKPLSKTL